MCYLHVSVIFGFVVAQFCGKEDDDAPLVHCCHFWFCYSADLLRKGQHKISYVIILFFSFRYNAIQCKEEDDNDNALLAHHHCFGCCSIDLQQKG
jgi:hypothetical protein